MEKIKKELIIAKSRYPEDKDNHVLFLHTKTKRGESWRRVFKGSYKECITFRAEMIK